MNEYNVVIDYSNLENDGDTRIIERMTLKAEDKVQAYIMVRRRMRHPTWNNYIDITRSESDIIIRRYTVKVQSLLETTITAEEVEAENPVQAVALVKRKHLGRAVVWDAQEVIE